MRMFGAALFATCALAQSVPFTLDQVMSAPFPSGLTASPTGAKIAWVSSAKGVRNILVAEPPHYRARNITSYTEDDGQELAGLRWMPDASAIVYVRGGSANPALNTSGVTEDVWVVALDGSAPRKIGEGNSPAVSPKGDRVVWVRGGSIWWSPFEGKPAQAFTVRGSASRPVWSPDGARIAFTSARGDHALIGVYEVAANALRYLDPATDDDRDPEWSPDSRSVAFIRVPSTGKRAVREAQRAGEPWSIRVASAETGAGREIWHANPGAGSVFRGVTARNQLLWGNGGHIVFPWEGDGWTHLYSLPAAGGPPMLLTPGAFEVEDVDLRHGSSQIVYSSNQGDIDRHGQDQRRRVGGNMRPANGDAAFGLDPREQVWEREIGEVLAPARGGGGRRSGGDHFGNGHRVRSGGGQRSERDRIPAVGRATSAARHGAPVAPAGAP